MIKACMEKGEGEKEREREMGDGRVGLMTQYCARYDSTWHIHVCLRI
jgi:hypothetical protein